MNIEVLFEHSVATWIVASGVAAVVILGALTFWRYLKVEPVTFVLGAMRLLFILLLTWCILLPLGKRSHVEIIKPHFVVALDTSASMELTPRKEIPSRWHVSQSVLAQNWTKVLSAQRVVDVFPFAEDLGSRLALPQSAGLSADGRATHLRDSLLKIVDRYKGQNVSGLLLLSDGLDTKEGYGAWAAQSWPFPIFTVRLEPPVTWEVKPDVRVDTLATQRRVTVGWSSELKAVISGEGTKGQVLNVRLSEDDHPIQELPTQIPAEGGTREVVFQVKHNVVGSFVYRVDVAPLEGEGNTNDNSFAVSVQVMDTRNQLLFVDDVPRWESKYLARALNAMNEITPLCFVRGPGGRFLAIGKRGNMTLDLTDEQISRFKIIILGDLNAAALGEQRAAALVKFTETGGSLVLLGGPNAWGSKGFEQTALKKLLPVHRAVNLPAAEGKFMLQLTDEGRSHPAFAAETNLWQSIPPVLSVFPGGVPAAGASAVLAAKTDAGVQPIIFVQRYGQGKVMAILSDSLWRWQLTPGKESSYYRFWMQMLQWMMPAQGEAETSQIDLFSDVDQVFMGEAIALNARVTGVAKTNENQIGAVVCEILTPDNRRLPFPMQKQNVVTTAGKSYAGYTVQFRAEQSGLYRGIGSMTIGGKKVESAPYSFLVKPYTPESNPRPPNVELLKMLSKESGGQFCETNEVDAVLSGLDLRTSQEERITYFSLWDNWPLLSCMLLLLVLEWILRRARNMA